MTHVPPGSYTLRVTVDPLDHVQELDETNNVATVPVTIPPRTTCDTASTIPPEGGTVVATTSGVGHLQPRCGGTVPAPELVFRWTPAISGRAVISTCGVSTTFDTVLMLTDASCDARRPRACNDDTRNCPTSGVDPRGSHGSRLRARIKAGQTYYIVVDGAHGESGTFALFVTPP